jgi:hypothetical protein
MGDTPESSCGTVFAFRCRCQYTVAAFTVAISMGAAIRGSHGAHTIDMKTGINGALTIEEMNAMLTKMMAAEEAKKATLPTALPPSPSLDALRSPSPSFPPPRSGHLQEVPYKLGTKETCINHP